MSSTILRFFVVLQALSRIQDVLIGEFELLIQNYKSEIKTVYDTGVSLPHFEYYFH